MSKGSEWADRMKKAMLDKVVGGKIVYLAATGTMVEMSKRIWDNGGLTEQETATILTNSGLKVFLSNLYADAHGKFTETSRNVGGVNLTTIVTDFGTLNVMVDRQMPQGTLAVSSLEQCAPVYLEIPGKGHFFAEELTKTGATDRTMLYGEVGLAYGNEKAHGKLEGLPY